jgi:hypothetical protein
MDNPETLATLWTENRMKTNKTPLYVNKTQTTNMTSALLLTTEDKE